MATVDGPAQSLTTPLSTLDPPSPRFEPRPAKVRSTARAWVFALLEEGELTSLWSRIAETVLIGLILANVAAVALETIPSIDKHWHKLLGHFERLSVIAYTLEYAARMWCSIEDPRVAARGPIRGRLAFALRPLMIVDFLAFAPSYLRFIFPIDLRVLRIFRLFRLVKLARYSQALPALLGVLYAERSALFASTILLISTMFISGEVMHMAEGAVQPNVLGTLPDALYWAITTLTTVGYGDVTPHTPVGKLIAGVTMVIGLALFALPIGIIANGFISGLNRRRFAITWSILKNQPLLADLEVEALSDVLECATADVVREHGQITVAGEEATGLYLIVSGAARHEHLDDPHTIHAGDVVGAVALRHHATYAYTVTARSETRVIGVPREDLRRLARKHPLLRQRLDRLMEEEIASNPAAIEAEGRIQALEAENATLRRALSDILLERMEAQRTAAQDS